MEQTPTLTTLGLDQIPDAALAARLVEGCRLPWLRAAPRPPPWTIRRLGARLRTPERLVSRVGARVGLSGPPPRAAPKTTWFAAVVEQVQVRRLFEAVDHTNKGEVDYNSFLAATLAAQQAADPMAPPPGVQCSTPYQEPSLAGEHTTSVGAAGGGGAD